MLEGLIGTRGAFILDGKLNILGKVPFTELVSTLNSLKTGVYAVVFDGIVDSAIVEVAERANLRYIIAMDNQVKNSEKVNIITVNDL